LVTSYRIFHENDTSYNLSPKDWTFEGSTDGQTWVVLDRKTGQMTNNPGTNGSYGSYVDFDYLAANPYRYYRLNITDWNRIGGTSFVGITEVELYRSPLITSDVDSDGLSLRIESMNSGTLEKRVGEVWVAVTPGTTVVDLNGMLRWTPPLNANGVLNAFTIAAWDGLLASTGVAQVTVEVSPVNDVPALAAILGPYSGGFNQPQTIPLSASDVETSLGDLVFTASSSNPTLFPNGNLAIRRVISGGIGAIGGSMGSTNYGGSVSQIGNSLGGGSYISLELVATPATGQSGEADITVTVIDGGGALASQIFHINVLDAYTTWANQYFGQMGENTVQTADPDGDGATNEQEFVAGTNPNDSASGPYQPVAFGDAFTAKLATGMTTKVTTASLISNDKYSGIPAETRGVTFQGAATTSTKGATIEVKAGWLIYRPSASAQNGTSDTFTYTVSNGIKTATGTVTVSLVTPEYVAEVSIDRKDGNKVYFSVMPGMTLEVQGTSQLGTGATWTTIAGPNSGYWTSGADGRLTVTDPAAVGSASRFYKFRWIP
jgi:hypothetical protein